MLFLGRASVAAARIRMCSNWGRQMKGTPLSTPVPPLKWIQITRTDNRNYVYFLFIAESTEKINNIIKGSATAVFFERLLSLTQ